MAGDVVLLLFMYVQALALIPWTSEQLKERSAALKPQ